MKAGVIVGILLLATIVFSSAVVREQTNPETGTSKLVLDMGSVSAEYSPGAGNIESGWLEIFIVNHTATPDTTYSQNTSATIEGWCTAAGLAYADTDAFSEDIASETSFDIVARGRWNKTHAWDATEFIDTRCRIKITVTCDDWADGENIADVEGDLVVTRNNTADDFIWCNVYWNAVDNNGFQIADDATLTVSEISIEGKY